MTNQTVRVGNTRIGGKRSASAVLTTGAVIGSMLAIAPVAATAVSAFDGVDPVISEVTFNPASAEDNWEWIEIHNPDAIDLDLAGWTIDDSNNSVVAAPNIAAGIIPAGASGVLYNADDVTAADFEAAWGTGINLIPVTSWSAMGLNNSGDTIGLWDDVSLYTDDQATQANAVVSVTYDGSLDDGAGSVYLTDLADQASWALSIDGVVTPVGTTTTTTAAGGNSGADVGSPGGTQSDDGGGDDGGGDDGVMPSPGDLAFSQYMEGSSNNKAVEILNTTTESVDLSSYVIERYSNGGVTPANIELAGTIAPGDVYVVANPSSNADILAVADLTSGNANWNGDDALVLRNGDSIEDDSIGQVGFDPGSEWGDATLGTQNESLCRTAPITVDQDTTDAYDPSARQWIALGQDSIEGLGNPTCSAQPVGDLLLTQYVEGSSNNKAIEIANLTGAPIDFGGYAIEIYFNGSATVSSTIALDSVVVPNGDVFVVANSSSNAAILAVADQTTGSVSWNGDDAIVLRNIAATTVADSIGQTSFDPGSQWGDPALGTQNNTLCRLDAITSSNGDTDPSNVFDPSVEWTALGNDSIVGLGEVGCVQTPNATPALISEVQGSGAASPLVGERVELSAIVTATFQGTGQIGGFFIQEEIIDFDFDDLTSEGVYVFDDTPVTVGDLVQVTGTVEEFFDSTQIGTVETVLIEASGQVLPSPYVLSLPYAEGFDFESIEHMSVQVPGPLVVTDTFTTGRFGEVRVSINEPLLNPTQAAEPGAAANAVGALNDRSQVVFDDGRSGSELADVAYFGSDGTLRRGDVAADGLAGVMSYSFGAYKIQPTFDPLVADIFTRVDERELTPPDVGGTVQVASFNVLNYFTTLDERGADSAEELTRQRDKIVAAVTGLDADVVGLIEVENNDAAIADLVDGFNDVAGAGTYAYIDTGAIGTDAIKVGFVYQPAAVTPVGDFAVLDSTVDPTFLDSKNRPALVVTFEDNLSGERFTVAINHFKSKGSDCDDLGDPDAGDEQGNCNLTRTSAATALVNFLATDPTNGETDAVIILGDINAYPNEDPITAFTDGGYIDLLTAFAPEAQSFVFFGEGGRLDHALVSPSLAESVTGADEWSINAAEPTALDYNVNGADGNNPPGLYVADPFRSSDHDPVLVGLEFTPVGPPEILMVVGTISGAGAPPAGDAAIVALLEGAGYDVTLVDDDVATAADADGRELVIISTSVIPAKIGTEFSDVDVPLVSWEGYLFDELGFNASGGGRNGETSASRNNITIVDDSNPLAAGLTGNATVTTNSNRFAFSRPEGDVQVAAEVTGRAVLFGYEAGASMAGVNVAPQRRVGLFPSYSGSVRLTSVGEDIVLAAVAWALSPPGELPDNKAPVVNAGFDSSITLPDTSKLLGGSIGDDGRTNILDILWTGPEGVTFNPDDDGVTTVTFPGAGSYELVLTVDDGEFVTSDEVTITVIDAPIPDLTVAFVAGSASPPRGDRPIVARLEAEGAEVTIIDDDDAANVDYSDFDVIFVSTSVVFTKIGDLFVDSIIPLITTEQYLLDDNLMSSSEIGVVSTSTVQIVDENTSLAAGLDGSVTISSSTSIGYGTPTESAVEVASASGRSVYFAYDIGAPMVDGFTAPARRVFFPGAYLTAQSGSADYFDMLDAAIEWALDADVVPLDLAD